MSESDGNNETSNGHPEVVAPCQEEADDQYRRLLVWLLDFVRHIEEPTLEDFLAFIRSFDTLEDALHGLFLLKQVFENGEC